MATTHETEILLNLYGSEVEDTTVSEEPVRRTPTPRRFFIWPLPFDCAAFIASAIGSCTVEPSQEVIV